MMDLLALLSPYLPAALTKSGVSSDPILVRFSSEFNSLALSCPASLSPRLLF